MAVTEVAETAGADSKGSFCAVTFWAYSPDRKCECVSTWYLSPWAEGSPGAIPSLSDLQGLERHLLWGCWVEVLEK